MKAISRYLVAGTLIWAPQAPAEVFLFDDFSSAPSLEKYTSAEETVQLDTAAENLVLRSSGRAYTWNQRSNWLVALDSDVHQMQADVTLIELDLGNAETQIANARLCGTFYNSLADEPGNALGDVFACIHIGDKGLGPEAWWTISESISDDFSSAEVQIGTFGTVELNTTYTLSMIWDGDNTWGFTFDNGATVFADGPVNTGGPSARFRGIGTRLLFAIDYDNSTQFILSDALETPDDGSPATVVATVDNYVTEGMLHDDFSAPRLQQSDWSQYSTSTERVNGKLEMRATGAGGQENESLALRSREVTSLGADITLLSSSTVNNTTRIRGRITLVIGNDTYDVSAGDTPNGFEGSIWTQFLIERVGGVNQAVIYAERGADADWNTYEELFWMPLANPIALDQEYSVLVEKTGTLVEYFLDGQLVHSFDAASDYGNILSGNIYEVTYDEHASLQARVDDDAGEVRVRFDNIVTDYMPATLTLNAIDAANAEIELPDEVIANEGEIIDLVASVSDPAEIAAYIWEQTAGPDVDVVASRALAARAIGSEQTLSFTVPAGSDGQDLEFRVTIVDLAGIETAQDFVVSVDNSADSTLATDSSSDGAGDADDDDDDDDDGGSSAFGPLSLIFGLLLAAITYRRRL